MKGHQKVHELYKKNILFWGFFWGGGGGLFLLFRYT